MGNGGSEAAPRILGLTGPIGCGKTTVGTILLALGAIERIDADDIVHELMGPGTETTRRVRAEFGPGVIAGDSGVNRKALAAVVFGNDRKLRLLESIVHPAVRREVRRRVALLRGRRGVLVLDAVRLLQSDLLPMVSQVWVVRCDPRVQLHRLVEARGMSEADARARLTAQPSFDHPAVNRTIENSTSRAELEDVVRRAWLDFNQHSTD